MTPSDDKPDDEEDVFQQEQEGLENITEDGELSEDDETVESSTDFEAA